MEGLICELDVKRLNLDIIERIKRCAYALSRKTFFQRRDTQLVNQVCSRKLNNVIQSTSLISGRHSRALNATTRGFEQYILLPPPVLLAFFRVT